MSLFDVAEQRQKDLKDLKQKIHTAAENQIKLVAGTLYGNIREKIIKEISSDKNLNVQEPISGYIDINNKFCDEYCKCYLFSLENQIRELNMSSYDDVFYSVSVPKPYGYPECTFSLKNIEYKGIICHHSFLKKRYYYVYHFSFSKAGEKVINYVRQFAANDNVSVDAKFISTACGDYDSYGAEHEIENGGTLKLSRDCNSRRPINYTVLEVLNRARIRIKYVCPK